MHGAKHQSIQFIFGPTGGGLAWSYPASLAMSSPSIAPRLVAEDVADWYLSVLDRTVAHSENVREHLKQALHVITRRM